MNGSRISRRESKRDLRKDPKRDGEEATDRPYRLFSASEVAIEMDVPPRFITEIRKVGAPFLFGQSHPAWVFDWVKEHANDKAPPAQPLSNSKSSVSPY